MGTMTEFALLVLGLAGLWFGTEITIRGAVTLANRLGISEFIIGVAVLSIGSDLPELAISIDGALKSLAGGDASDVVIGTALGSYLGQLGFVLGFVALFQRLTLSHGTILRHGAALVGSLVLLALTGLDGVITRFEGVMLVSAYVVYFAALFVGPGTFTKEEAEQPPTGLGVAWILLVVGLVIVVVGAELTVSNAIRLAVSMNVSEAFVSIVLIGMGTSLPELSISLGAVLKNRASMSVGNLIGSNVFDTLVPVGVAAAIATLGFNPAMLAFEIPYLIVLTIVVMFFFWRIPGIQRHEAVIILLMYVGYVAFKFQSSMV